MSSTTPSFIGKDGANAGPKVPVVDLNYRIMCPDCKDEIPNIIEDFSAGDLVCGSCGMVLGNRIIDTRSEWRTFNNDEEDNTDPSRVGAAGDPLLGGLDHLDSTTISGRDGKGISATLNRIQAKSIGVRAEKQLLAAWKELATMCERIGLSKLVVDSAKQIYKKIQDENLLKGKSQEAIMTTCIYIACREQSVTRSYKELYALSRISIKELGRCVRVLKQHFDKPVQQVSVTSFISRFSSHLDLSPEVQRGTFLVANKVKQLGTLAGKSPVTLVAGCIYFVSCLSLNPRTAKEVADKCGCTEATLKSAYKLLYDSRAKLLPPDFKMARDVDSLPPP
ncbi:hypothetical protein CXG81DRAFT_12823 [Caulochytrium protostelioides]|uniref:Transcription initiation factor IIB n=1 Tax=Caulochytrium protostelioides TaxID=1555241 RepID=A0A4P9X6K2_9FUNG|nr:hypothetical protein CXG81DRAFT_12823 [Caulochytrium protostelioides]|eukprot:RKP00792.1 hypothetical protein CXG81DRAFT_12823 [Caulochytrium protostelioides]